MKTVFLIVTSAIALSGEIAKPGELIEVTEAEAVNFLAREKARLATEADGVETPGMFPAEGPTVEEFVAAGYRAENYPPDGYASRSTDDEILAAITAQESKGNKEA